MKAVDPKEVAQKLNTVRLSNVNITRQEWEKLKLPYNQSFLTECVRSGIVIRVERNVYKFRATPIYYKEVISIIDSIKSKYYPATKAVVISNEERAINYLKSLGYKIFKEV